MRRPLEKMKKISGIYQIRNLINNKVYIGRTGCFYLRYYAHLRSFKHRDKNEINNHLLNAINKYGINNFSFEILEICDKDFCVDREVFWILTKKALDPKRGYNLRSKADGKVFTSQEVKKRISESIKHKWKNPEFKRRVSQKLKLAWCDKRKASMKNNNYAPPKFAYFTWYEGECVGPYRYNEILMRFPTVENLMYRTKRNLVSIGDGFVERRLL